jgi:hypothetical protein
MGTDADDPSIRAATRRAAGKVKSNRREARAKRRLLRTQASEPPTVSKGG